MSEGQRLQRYRTMVLIREFEMAAAKAYKDQSIPGFCHVSIGQEAVPVGVLSHMRDGDVLTSTHRGHGHAIAAGIRVVDIMAELFGKADGVCGGRGGSMHVAQPSRGVLGANGIVAGGIPTAVGAAWAMSRQDQGNVAFAFLGDGAVAQGAFHEAANLAATWRLPLVFVCENNQYAEFSPVATQGPAVELHQRLSGGYGIPARRVDGNALVEVLDAASWATELARGGQGPVFVEADTYRWEGHYVGDPGKYRPEGELDHWKSLDPLVRERHRLDEEGVDGSALDEVERDVADEVARAVESAGNSPHPDPGADTGYVYAGEWNGPVTGAPATMAGGRS